MSFIEISKYLFTGLFAIFTLISYIGATMHNKKTLNGIYGVQTVITIAFLAIGNIVLFTANDNDMKYLTLLGFELALIIVTIVVYDLAYKKASKLLVNNMLFLISVGLVIIARLDYDNVVRQLIFVYAGMVITFFIPMLIKKMRFLRNLGWVYATIGVVLLAIVLVASRVTYGAKISINIGGFTFQPSEFVKILFVFCIASMFNKAITWKQIIITTAIALVHIVILVASNDLGAAIIFFVVYLMMLYVATRKVYFLLGGAGLGFLGAFLAEKAVPHVAKRFEAWKDPWSNIYGSGYQIAYALFSIAAGGWFGTGLTQGSPTTIPFVANDMVFAAITEEMGMISGILLLFICLNCIILIMNIASKCNTLFYRLVAVGLGATYAFQVFLTVGGTIKLIPLTGVTLPFVSYGGSSIISSLIMFAFINGMYNMRQVEQEVGTVRTNRMQQARPVVTRREELNNIFMEENFNEHIDTTGVIGEKEVDIVDDSVKSKKKKVSDETGGYFISEEDEYRYEIEKHKKAQKRKKK